MPNARDPREINHWFLVNALLPELHEAQEGLRPNYTWPILHAASVALRTGRERISVIEFGVAGGAGLVAMEAAALATEARLGVAIDVVGFDTGQGLPPPRDHRDAPFLMNRGDFPMDETKLRAELKRGELVLGDVAETVPAFIGRQPAPIAFIAFDLDFYSSTRDALTILTAAPEKLLPRVLCYFDDTHGYPWGEVNGARLAIAEFNSSRKDRQLAQLHGLRYLLPVSERGSRWPEAMYVAHAFDHPHYADPEGTELARRLDLA